MQLHCYRAKIQANGKWLTDFIYAADLDAAKVSWKRAHKAKDLPTYISDDPDPEQAEWEYQGEVPEAVIDADGWPVTQ